MMIWKNGSCLGLVFLVLQLTGSLGGLGEHTGLVETLGIVELVVVDVWM